MLQFEGCFVDIVFEMLLKFVEISVSQHSHRIRWARPPSARGCGAAEACRRHFRALRGSVGGFQEKEQCKHRIVCYVVSNGMTSNSILHSVA